MCRTGIVLAGCRPLSGNTDPKGRAIACGKDCKVTPSDKIERPVNLILVFLVIGSIAAVGYADYVVTSISLGYLYVLPLALSGFVFRLPTSLALMLCCFVLQDWFGPFAHSGWQHMVRNLFTLFAFVTVVLVVDRLVRQRTRLTDLVRQQRDELAREVDLAAHVQARLLPPGPPVLKGFDIAGCMVAARTAGGDYFDYLKLPDGHLGLVIADVSGKGVSAALLMSSVKTALWAGAPSALNSSLAVRNLNKGFYELTDLERYVTLFYGRLDPVQGLLEYTNAGHLPPLLFHGATGEFEWLEVGGTVVGLFPAAEYDCGQVQLKPGDTLVLYTDGVTEATNAAGKELTCERLVPLVRENATRSAQHLVEAISSAVTAYRGTSVLEDDLTLVVLRAISNLPYNAEFGHSFPPQVNQLPIRRVTGH
jgi:serine phosphatase RsbU (regulator of sigma subunit)